VTVKVPEKEKHLADVPAGEKGKKGKKGWFGGVNHRTCVDGPTKQKRGIADGTTTVGKGESCVGPAAA